MKRSKAIFVLSSAALAVLGVRGASADVITQWAFNATVAAPDNSPSPTTDVPGGSTAVSLGMTNSYTYSGGETTPTTTNDDITQPNTSGTPASNEFAWRIRGANNKSGKPGNGWNNSAPNYTQGAEFISNTSAYTNLNLSFDWYATTQGVANLQVLYTLDASDANPTWVPVGSDFVQPGNNFYGAVAPSTPSTTPNISINIPASGANFAVELVSVRPVLGDSNYASFTAADTSGGLDYASAAGGDYNNSSGNWSFNNVTISGDLASVPEPASVGLLGLSGLSLLARRRESKAK